MRAKTTVLWILILFLIPLTAYTEESAGQAKELTKDCSIDFGSYEDAGKYVLNKSVRSYATFRPGNTIKVSWKKSVPAKALCLQWAVSPTAVRVTQLDENGKTLSKQLLPEHPESVIHLDPAARSVTIRFEKKKEKLSQLHVYGDGTLPEPFHEWEETPDHLDYLLIATHSDDDVLFLGSVIPVYGMEKGYVGSIAYVTCQNRVRMTEAENGAWTMGLRYRPLFLGFPDVDQRAPARLKKKFVYEDVLRSIVQVYRKYHPVVVFAQDSKGEYGHWQHKQTSKAAVEAYRLAADPSFDPESYERYGTWQVQKVYLHLYSENKLQIDADSPLHAFDGRDAFEVAKEAYKKHVSQQKLNFAVSRNKGKYAFNRFGMAEGAVEAGNDVFDNIDETLLSCYAPPTPEPTPEPTLEPTATPESTPGPTSQPTPEPTFEPTSEPAPVLSVTEHPEEGQDAGEQKQERTKGIPIGAAVALGTLSTALIISGLFLMRKKPEQEED